MKNIFFISLLFFFIPSYAQNLFPGSQALKGSNKVIIKGITTFNTKPLTGVKIILSSVCYYVMQTEYKSDLSSAKYLVPITGNLRYHCLKDQNDTTSIVRIEYFMTNL